MVWHTTESGAGNAAFDSVGKYLRTIGAEPHVLYDPTTDRLGQFGPLNASARALRNDGSTRTNRTGKVCIQIEVLARAATPFTGYWKPGKNFKALMAAIRSWGVPDATPLGSFAKGASRDRNTWLTKGGHYGHCNVPGNDHWDPGAISAAKLFAAAPVGGTPKPPAPPASTASYTVKSGDTLSKIGAALKIKWQDLAAWNGIKAPYTITVGQVLKLKGTTTPPAPKPKPVVDLSQAVAAAKADPNRSQGNGLYESNTKIVEAALRSEGLLSSAYASDGAWGTVTVTAYKAWQRKLGYTGGDADGIPGMTSLAKLGTKHGFTVKP